MSDALHEQFVAIDPLNGEFYNALTLAVTAGAIVLAVLGVLYARAAILPAKRRLVVSALPAVRLLATPDTGTAQLTVTRLGQTLADPHVVTLSIENVGRHAVSSTHYDRDRPIMLDLGTPVEEILDTTSIPLRTNPAQPRFSGSVIEFGPELLKRGQKIVIQALTADRPDLENIVTEHLVDTGVEYRAPNAHPDVRSSRKTFLVVVLLFIFGVSLGAASAMAISSLSKPVPQPTLQVLEVTSSLNGTWWVLGGTGFRPNTPFVVELACYNVTRLRQPVNADKAGAFQVQIPYPEVDPFSANPCFPLVRDQSGNIITSGESYPQPSRLPPPR